MEIKIPTLGDMPTPVKVGVLLASGGGIGAAVAYIPSEAKVMVAAGVALVGFILLLYSLYLKGRDRRKAAPMEKGVLEGASSVPAGISEPARRARLDDLHKKFQTGIERYRAAGKNLYEFPWYLVVGEPGSGKTEAIRHCNIGFPPGLQDELQGVGGTVNMNWWFTDHAVILDTAGRMMFEEIEAGGSEEWKEFLRLLRRYRPNCPINGVFLFIPADSLVKDTADTIEQKAKKISLQFDMIQRTLDVRFPVYIVVSKSDLMYGFRDFFEGVEDPELQHQILGWSNVSSLDEPYNPELLEHHLGAVRHRLLRRRSGLLQQSGVEIDAEGERLRQAEGFYAFPLSLEKLVPRMARYLELIFAVGSKWSLKPLFFRGIYFTSAMQQGSALDQDLAGALGVPVDSLPDGRVWMREKAFFLRDLFLKKVFPEKGLVTRATNATRLYIRRKAAVLLAAVISVIALLSFTIYAYIQWKDSVGDLKKYLVAANDQIMEKGKQIINTEGKYAGEIPVAGEGVLVDSHQFYLRLAESVKQYRDTRPWIFRPATLLGGNDATGSDLADALATVYETGVLKPLMKKAAEDLTKADSTVSRSWVLSKTNSTESALQVLHDFLAIQAGIQLLHPTNIDEPTDAITEARQRGYTTGSFLDPLFPFGSVPDVDDEKHTPKKDLRDAFGLVYYDEKSDTTRRIQAIDPDLTMTKALVAAFENYWDKNNPDDPDLKAMNSIQEVSVLLDQFKTAEEALRAVVLSPGQDELDKVHSRWQERFGALADAYKQLNTPVPALENANGKSLDEVWAGAEGRVNKNLTESCKFLTDDLGAIAGDSELGKIRERILNIMNHKSLTRPGNLKDLDDQYYAKNGAPQNHLYAIRYEIYRNASLESEPNTARPGLSYTIQDIKEKKGKRHADIDTLQKLLPIAENESKNPAIKATPGSDAKTALNIATEVLVRRVVDEFLKNAPKDVAAIEGYVLKKSEGQNGDKGTGLPPTESNECKSERRYHPRFAAEYINDWFLAGDLVGKAKDQDSSESQARTIYDKATPEVNQYLHAYITYWLAKYPDQLETTPVPVNDSVTRIDHWFMNLSDECKALTALGDYLDKTAVTPIFDHISQDKELVLVRLFREELDNNRKETMYGEIRRLLDGWRKPDVRSALAKGLTEGDTVGLKGTYFNPTFFDKVQPGQFVHLRIQKLIAVSLDDMAKGFQKQVTDEASNFLNDYGKKFPLSWEATPELNREKFGEALVQWAKIGNIVASSAIVPATSIFNDNPNEGIQERLRVIDANLKQLNRVTLPSEISGQIKKIQEILPILPQKYANPNKCVISWSTADTEKCTVLLKGIQVPVRDKVRAIVIKQSNGPVEQLTANDKVTLEYPSSNAPLLLFNFFEGVPSNVTTDKPWDVVPFVSEGGWACLRMIQQRCCGNGKVRLNFNMKQLNDNNEEVIYPVCIEVNLTILDNKGNPLETPDWLWTAQKP